MFHNLKMHYLEYRVYVSCFTAALKKGWQDCKDYRAAYQLYVLDREPIR